MSRLRLASPILMGLVVASGCSLNGPAMAPERPSSAPTNAQVIGPDELWGRAGSLLRVLEHSVPALEVSRSAGCPSLSLRGQRRLQGPSDPKVYVEGQAALDTCILDYLMADDVASVEIYPMGITHRPGYLSHAFGLILVFTRDATS